jgi:peptidyl-prolyl cis-trans isomerase SurA
VEVSQEDVEKGFAAIARQNNMKPSQFKAVLVKNGIPRRTMLDQIRAQIAWTNVVQEKLRSKIQVSDKDVEDRLDRLRASKGKTEYLVSEIFLPKEKETSQTEVKNLAGKLVSELRRNGAPFQAVARQFSKAAGASSGGDLGWIQADQMPEELAKVISSMDEGSISDPVKSPRGYHIFALRKKRKITEKTISPREHILKQIGMERLDRLQQRYLLDLKSEAFIEKRV